MSALLEAAIGVERRMECLRNDAALVASITAPGGKALMLDRGQARPVAGDSFDAVLAGLEAGASRVQVCANHAPQVERAAATADLSPKDGIPNGWFYVSEDLRCACCGKWSTRDVVGARARSAGGAMEKYRAGVRHG